MAMLRAFVIVSVLGIAIGTALPLPGSRPAPVATRTDRAVDPARAVDTAIERGAGGYFLTIADVNGEPVRFVVDTGADIVALTAEDAERAHVAFDRAAFRVVGHGASGDVRGQDVRIGQVTLDGKRADGVSGVVLESGPVSLLGQSYLRHLQSVEIRGDTMTLR